MRRALFLSGAVVVAEILYAVLRPSPDLKEFDPSGIFGHQGSPPLKVAVLGDSSVTAPGVAVPEEIWISRLCSRLGEHFRVELRSFAVGGSRAADVLDSQVGPALDFAPDVAFLAIGANDAIRGVALSTFERDLEQIVIALAGSGARVFLTGVGDLGTIPRLYPPLSTFMTIRSSRYNAVHGDLAAKHQVGFIDQRQDKREPWVKDRGMWAPDLFHASAKGHARWADLGWEAIEPLVPKLKRAVAKGGTR